MRGMDDRTLRVLEYEKILEMLAEHCSFSLSKEFARSLRPRTNPQFVRGLLSETTEALSFLHSAGEPPFGAVTDVRDAASRAKIGSQLSGEDLWAICETLRSGSRYKRAVLEASGHHPILKGLAAGLADLNSLRALLERSIGEEGEVLDGASSTLASIRRDITVTGNRIRDRMESFVKDPGMIGRLQEAIITVRNDRYVVPVKQEFRNSVKGIVHDQSSSGATLFIEPLQVVEMNNRLVELRSQELEEVNRILKSLSGEVAAVADEIRSNVDTLARMDMIFAKAKLSRFMRGVEPEISDRQALHLRNARHPLLKGKVVPVSPSRRRILDSRHNRAEHRRQDRHPESGRAAVPHGPNGPPYSNRSGISGAGIRRDLCRHRGRTEHRTKPQHVFVPHVSDCEDSGERN